MNKNTAKYLLILAAAALAGGGCNVDDYNTEYLDGFEPGSEITDTQTFKYTLTANDYSTIASNAANKAIAEAAGADAVAALAAVGANKMFSEAAPASTYLPAFLATNYDSYLSNGSAITVTYKSQRGEISETVTAIGAAGSYTVGAADYQAVWGETPANFFTPANPLEDYADGLLKAANPEAEAGAVEVVTYNWSDTEPYTGGEALTATKIDETFSKGLDSWQIVTGSSSSTWSHDDYNGVQSAKASAFKTTGAQDLWLISEKVDLSMTERPELAFDVKIAYWTHDGLSVLVSTDYDGIDPEKATWTDLTHDFAFAPKNYGWYPAGVCDMSAYKSESVYVAFRYQGNADEQKTTTYYIDNIQLGETGVVTVAAKELFADTFESLDKWTLVKVAGEDDKQWKLTTYSGNSYAQASANKAAGAVESWLVSKEPIAVPAASEGHSVLGFDLKIGYWNADCFSVLVSEDYAGDVAKANWTDLTEHLLIPQAPTSGYANNFSPAGLASLYGVNGKSVYVAFRYIGDGAHKQTTTYQVDNVKVATLSRNTAAAAAAAMTRAASTKRYALYSFDGLAWAPTADAAIICPEDYAQMGSSHANFSSSFPADTYVPRYLRFKYPYAQADDKMTVAYHYYTGNATVLQADEYTCDGNDWIKTENFEELDAPFKKAGGKWNFDPSMTIVLSPTSNTEVAKAYYQAGVDWVIAHKDPIYRYYKESYVTNAEYYSGCAAGYYNLNWRINTLPVYYWKPAGEDTSVYDKWSSEDKAEVRAAYDAFYKEAEKRFGEVMSGALGMLHPDVKPIEGIDIIYTVQAYLYTMHHTAKELTHAFEFKVVGPGQFEYVRMYALDPKFELMSDENFE